MQLLLVVLCIGCVSIGEASVFSGLRAREARARDERQQLQDVQGTLTAVQIVHRHGDRAPVHFAPAMRPVWTALGLAEGQLSSIGVAQHLAFGRYLRDQYLVNGFVPAIWTPASMRVRSTDVDRCLQSVTSLLRGFYQSPSPVPVHTVPTDQDVLLQPDDKCPSYGVSYPQVQTQYDAVAKQMDADSGIVAKVAQLTQWNDTLAPNVLLDYTQDNVICALSHNLPIAQYLVEKYPIIKNFTQALHFDEYKFVPGDPRGPVGGQLVRQIVSNFHSVQNPLTIYSAHDSTIISLFTGLGLLKFDSPQMWPPYAASTVFELRSLNGKLYVNARYGFPNATGPDHTDPTNWGYTQSDILLNCPTPTLQCELGAFADYINSIAPEFGTTQYCCQKVDGFAAQGCDAYATAYSALPALCQQWRRLCPASACASGQVVSGADQSCIGTTSPGTESLTVWRAVAAAASAVVVVFVIVGILCWRRQVAISSHDRYGIVADDSSHTR